MESATINAVAGNMAAHYRNQGSMPMTVNSVASNSPATTALDIRPATEQNQVKNAAPEKKAGAEKDEMSIAPKPSVNSSGQTIGTTISTKA